MAVLTDQDQRRGYSKRFAVQAYERCPLCGQWAPYEVLEPDGFTARWWCWLHLPAQERALLQAWNPGHITTDAVPPPLTHACWQVWDPLRQCAITFARRAPALHEGAA